MRESRAGGSRRRTCARNRLGDRLRVCVCTWPGRMHQVIISCIIICENCTLVNNPVEPPICGNVCEHYTLVNIPVKPPICGNACDIYILVNILVEPPICGNVCANYTLVNIPFKPPICGNVCDYYTLVNIPFEPSICIKRLKLLLHFAQVGRGRSTSSSPRACRWPHTRTCMVRAVWLLQQQLQRPRAGR